jgi:hypothetical protein
MLDPEAAWRQYQEGLYGAEPGVLTHPQPLVAAPQEDPPASSAPHPSLRGHCGPLYISTKTKIGYLNQPVPLSSVFWQVPVGPYHIPAEGVIKKQMKFNSACAQALAALQHQVQTDIAASHAHLEEHVISHIENAGGRIPFKDVRKVSIGLCRKDVTSYRSKRKGAFYNCFVVILRLLWERRYKEIHVKVFNTGKLEVPGIREEALLDRALSLLTTILDPLMPADAAPLVHLPEKSETVLVNSNFVCNFYIDRQKLFGLLRGKYNISCSYDPCSYPGIQAEFYYDHGSSTQTGRLPPGAPPDVLLSCGKIMKVSFMVFRTGSVLIVGKCSDVALREIYDFICAVLEQERDSIRIAAPGQPAASPSHSSRRARKRTITVHAPADQGAS